MKKFRVKFVQTVYETYVIEVEAENEEEVNELITEGEYELIEEESLVESYSDYIEVTEIEEINE